MKLTPEVYKAAAASVLAAECHGRSSLGELAVITQGAQPYACWAIMEAAAAAAGNASDWDCQDPHILAFEDMMTPDDDGYRPAFFWPEEITEESQEQRSLALLLMAEIVRGEQPPSTAPAASAA